MKQETTNVHPVGFYGELMEINYGDIIETIRDERGTVIGFENDKIVLRMDDGSRMIIKGSSIACLIKNTD